MKVKKLTLNNLVLFERAEIDWGEGVGEVAEKTVRERQHY